MVNLRKSPISGYTMIILIDTIHADCMRIDANSCLEQSRTEGKFFEKDLFFVMHYYIFQFVLEFIIIMSAFSNSAITLKYWNGRGLMEVPRMILAIAGKFPVRFMLSIR